jgi:hypothetical protein
MGACLLRYLCCSCIRRRKFKQISQSYEIQISGVNDINGISSNVPVWSGQGKTQGKLLNVDNLSGVMEVTPTEHGPQDIESQEQQVPTGQQPPSEQPLSEMIEERPVEPSFDINALVGSRLDIPYSMSSQPNRYNFLQRTHTLRNYKFPRKQRIRSN